MSSKHLFTNADGLVVKYLKGLITWNPSLNLIESERVVFDTRHASQTVSIISGGGAGHEPAWGGYVGENMLAASASGDIFASPSARQVEAAIKSVPSEKGTLLVFGNYTGDCLHFGMACEKAKAAGYLKGPIAVMSCGDDVSVGKKGNGLVGRRGLQGQLLVLKVLGAAAAEGLSFEEILSLGNALKDQIVSIATTLDHCHVPGRAEHQQLDDSTIEIGTGPHNEPGFKKISPQPTAEDIVETLIKYLVDESDPDRGYVKFAENDEVVVLINNFGGMSALEIGALTNEVLEQLPFRISPVRVYAGCFESSLNAPAFGLSLVNLTATAKGTGVKVSKLLDYLDMKTDSAWEAVAGSQMIQKPRKSQVIETNSNSAPKLDESKSLMMDPPTLELAIRSACNAVIAAEPNLTKWDTIMGDGDCGETFMTGAQELLKALDTGLAKTGSILTVFNTLSSITEEKMGGTLGAILSIFFNALVSEIARGTAITIAPAQACRELEKHTSARVGHRTIMDVLIPATRALEETGEVGKIVDAAKKGAESTRTLEPVLGRATYVGGMEGKELPPDPGAWGLMVAICGVGEVLGK